MGQYQIFILFYSGWELKLRGDFWQGPSLTWKIFIIFQVVVVGRFHSFTSC